MSEEASVRQNLLHLKRNTAQEQIFLGSVSLSCKGGTKLTKTGTYTILRSRSEYIRFITHKKYSKPLT